MRTIKILLLLVLFGISSCRGDRNTYDVPKETKSYVPVAGNSFITVKPEGSPEVITETGIGNWTNLNSVISTYFRVSRTGKLGIGIKASVPDEKTSVIKVTINGDVKEVSLKGSKLDEYNVGEFNIQNPGYVKVDVQGVKKTGNYIADVTDIIFDGEAARGDNIFANNSKLYDESRKGVTPYLEYKLPSQEKVEHLYSEITIPDDGDKEETSYSLQFIVGGILSMENKHDGKKVVMYMLDKEGKDEIELIDKGNVTINKLGNYHVASKNYDWETGKTYSFLVKISEDGQGNTKYAAWFAPKEDINKGWGYLAGWKKLNDDGASKMFSVRLESFDKEKGYLSAKAEFKNPWVITESGKWIPLTEANFGAYEVRKQTQRVDGIGGTTGEKLFLKSGGFFNDVVELNTKFSIPSATEHPDLEFLKDWWK